jgi:hypothetical protein
MLAVTADGRGVVRVDAYTPYGGRIGWLREYLATRFEKQLLILQRLFVVAKSADAAHLAWTTFWFVASAIAVYATLRKLIREIRRRRSTKSIPSAGSRHGSASDAGPSDIYENSSFTLSRTNSDVRFGPLDTHFERVLERFAMQDGAQPSESPNKD